MSKRNNYYECCERLYAMSTSFLAFPGDMQNSCRKIDNLFHLIGRFQGYVQGDPRNRLYSELRLAMVAFAFWGKPHLKWNAREFTRRVRRLKNVQEKIAEMYHNAL